MQLVSNPGAHVIIAFRCVKHNGESDVVVRLFHARVHPPPRGLRQASLTGASLRGAFPALPAMPLLIGLPKAI
jgi:hypothetical protein